MDDNNANIFMECEGGYPVSAPIVGSKVPLVIIDLSGLPKSVKRSPRLEVVVRLVKVKVKKKNKKKIQCQLTLIHWSGLISSSVTVVLGLSSRILDSGLIV